MILYLLIDLNVDDWQFTSKDIFNDLLVFLNAYHKSSRSNRVIIINNRKVLFDTQKNDISEIYKIIKNGGNYSVNDVGYAMCLNKAEKYRIVIFTLRKELENEYSKYLKCMFAAQRFKIRIDAFSLFENKTIEQCCVGTGGKYFTSEEKCLNSLLSLLGTEENNDIVSFPTYCYCHNKQVLLGLVCPICLSIFCKFVPVCKRCKTKFNFIK